jgi:hypothetical protein
MDLFGLGQKAAQRLGFRSPTPKNFNAEINPLTRFFIWLLFPKKFKIVSTCFLLIKKLAKRPKKLWI